MRILHVLNSSSFSGAENVAITIIKQLEKDSNYECYYVSPKGPIEERLREENVKYIPIEKLCNKELKRVIKEYKPDVIHAHDFRASLISILMKNKKTRIICHLHNNPPWLRKICINSFIYLIIGQYADRVIAVSESVVSEFVFSKLIKNKVHVIGNPLEPKRILEKISNISNVKKIYDVCCIARLTPQKNPERFIRIISILNEKKIKIRAIWIGDGEIKNEVIRICQKYHVQDMIEFIGFKANPFIYLNESKVFLLTSDWEGFGLVTYEAITLGVPCVVSNVGGINQIINDTCGKLCNPNEIDDYVNEIEKLLTDKEYYDIKVKNSLKQSIKLNNEKEYYRKIKELYEGG